MPAAFRDLWQLLTFRLPQERFATLGGRHLAVGLVFTWLAGVGRYWDSPRADWWQFAGLGSLAYVVGLSAILWVVIRPLTAQASFSFLRLLTFVCLTSPPALLYAIPVEKFCTLETATTLNIWFLGVVALWRVALLVFYLRRGLQLELARCAIGLVLPVSAILQALVALNFEHAVFELMAGLHHRQRTAADVTYANLIALCVLSLPFFVATFLPWLWLAGSGLWKRFRPR